MTSTRSPAPFGALAGLAALLVGPGCVANNSQEPEPQPAAQVERDHDHDHDRLHGPAGFVVETALEHGELTADQRARVDVIVREMRERRTDRHVVHRQMRTHAAEIVRAGSTDSERFDEAVGDAVGTIERRMDASAAVAVEVHGILDARQRGLVADRLQERVDEHRARRERRRERHHRRHGKLEDLAARLALTATQIDQLKEMGDKIKHELKGDRKRLRPTREEIDGLIAAFRTDSFEQDLYAFQDERLDIIRGRVKTAGDHTDTVLTLLSNNQRYLLADVIELGPEAVGLGDGDHRHDHEGLRATR